MFFSFLAAIVAGAAFFLSKRVLKAPLPRHSWRLFNHPAAEPLTEDQGQLFEGVYKVMRGYNIMGSTAAVKWTWIKENGIQKIHASIFFEKDAAYMICDVKELRNRVLLNGYWCKQDTAESGPVRLIIHTLNGGYRIIHRKPLRKKTIRIKGWIGDDRGGPRHRFVLKYQRSVYTGNSFHILGHRGAGRNADYYPYSENSLPMIKLGALLGATGIEIDVALSRDQVPVIFHDPVLSYRSLDDYYIVEPVSSKTAEELKRLKLKKGESMPTLEEAMNTVLYETPMELVWWDIKYAGDLQPLLDVYYEYIEKAKTLLAEGWKFISGFQTMIF